MITSPMRMFMETISPFGEIVDLELLPKRYFSKFECHYRAAAAVAEFGGTAIPGWTVVLKNNTMCACTHSLWRDDEGTLFETTYENPSHAFVTDDTIRCKHWLATFDGKLACVSWVPNPRLALELTPTVIKYALYGTILRSGIPERGVKMLMDEDKPVVKITFTSREAFRRTKKIALKNKINEFLDSAPDVGEFLVENML